LSSAKSEIAEKSKVDDDFESLGKNGLKEKILGRKTEVVTLGEQKKGIRWKKDSLSDKAFIKSKFGRLTSPDSVSTIHNQYTSGDETGSFGS